VFKINNIIKANQVKNGSFSKVYIKDKLINSSKSIILDIKPEICIGKILCYEVDQEVNDEVLVKSELENLLGKKFDVVIEDNDSENTNNNIISIKNCYMYKYYHFISGGNIRMMQYQFSFAKENKKEEIRRRI